LWTARLSAFLAIEKLPAESCCAIALGIFDGGWKVSVICEALQRQPEIDDESGSAHPRNAGSPLSKI